MHLKRIKVRFALSFPLRVLRVCTVSWKRVSTRLTAASATRLCARVKHRKQASNRCTE